MGDLTKKKKKKKKLYIYIYIIIFYITIQDLITILCHVGFSILQVVEHYSQTNFPIIKTKSYKGIQYKKVWRTFSPKWVKMKTIVIILSLL